MSTATLDRTTGIGASEVAIVLGLDKRRTPFDLWLEKTKRKQPFGGNRYTDMGKRIEPVIADLYAEERGVKLADSPPVRHAAMPIVWASPDRLVVGQDLGLECKAVFSPAAARDYSETRFPPRHAVQCIVGMACLDLPAWDLAALIGVDLHVYRIERDRDLERRILDRVAAWWEKHIIHGERPDIDGSEGVREYLLTRYPKNDGSILLAEAPEVRAIVENLAAAKLAKDVAEEQYEVAANRVRDLIADADGVEARGVGKVTWKKNKDGQSIDWEAIARDLAGHAGIPPSVIAQHTKARPGSRVLRCSFSNELASKELTQP